VKSENLSILARRPDIEKQALAITACAPLKQLDATGMLYAKPCPS
jgi:hypothetical protein